MLSVVDAYTRKCFLDVDTGFASRRVTRVLDAIDSAWRGHVYDLHATVGIEHDHSELGRGREGKP